MRYLSNKEKKQLADKLPKGYSIDKKDEIVEDKEILLKNKEPFLIIKDKTYFPHLKSVNENEIPSVYVDKGAIPFILKGADLMKPGIRKIDEGIENDKPVLIKDENHNKTIAIGISMFNSEDLEKQEKGKVIKIYHFVGDSYY